MNEKNDFLEKCEKVFGDGFLNLIQTKDSFRKTFKDFLDDIRNEYQLKVLDDECCATDKNCCVSNNTVSHINETETTWEVELLLPGIKKENLKISVTPVDTPYNQNYLEVFYQEEVKEQKEQQSFFKQTSFKKGWVLKMVDINSITSVYKDGILKISVNKLLKQKPETIQIEIQ